MTVSRCRACNAEIRWSRTVAGKSMPLDASPDPAGNVVLEHGRARVLGRSDAEQARAVGLTQLWMPHHATCTRWSRT